MRWCAVGVEMRNYVIVFSMVQYRNASLSIQSLRRFVDAPIARQDTEYVYV